MQKSIKNGEHVYTRTHKVESHLPFNWEVCPSIINYMEPDIL